MPDHGENYQRMKGPDGEEIGSLGPECGHHCLVQTVGNAQQMIRHCHCPECHGDQTEAVGEPESPKPARYINGVLCVFDDDENEWVPDA